MDKIEIRKKIDHLRNLIKKHDQLYYKFAEPEISDYEFDQMIKELAKLEDLYPEFSDNNSPTSKVGSDLNYTNTVIPHKVRMYSITNVYSYEEIKNYFDKLSQLINSDHIDVSLELKIDGFSINLFYNHGKLQYATTRGDGYKGEDVSNNIIMIPSIPQHINYFQPIEVRGEIYLPISEFNRINQIRHQQGDKLFANPRNAAAGTIKVKDSSIVKDRNLNSVMYGVGYFEESKIITQKELLLFLKKLGFSINNENSLATNYNQIIEYCNLWENKRSNLDYEIDGVVIKFNDLKVREKIGYTDKSPKWAIAYKFKAEKKTTKLRNVIFQVGRTGAVTPVALFDAIYIAGSTVSRATLHNEDELRRLNIHYEDTITIVKSGDIIPKVIDVDEKKRHANAKPIKFPPNCPACNTQLTNEMNGIIRYCNNINCPAQIKKRIEHFCSRKAMDIEGLGESSVSLLIDNNIISSLEDIYNIDYDEIKSLKYHGAKSTDNLNQSIEKSKEQPFDRVLYALGIRHVGDKTAKIIVTHFPSIDSLRNASIEDFTSIDEIGEKIAKSLYDFFRNEKSHRSVEKLIDAGLNFGQKTSSDETDNKKSKNRILAGYKFLVTGTLSAYTREEIHQIIEDNGGRVISNVSKNLDYLVIGDKPGSKLKKAQQLKTINIITETDFEQLLRG